MNCGNATDVAWFKKPRLYRSINNIISSHPTTHFRSRLQNQVDDYHKKLSNALRINRQSHSSCHHPATQTHALFNFSEDFFTIPVIPNPLQSENQSDHAELKDWYLPTNSRFGLSTTVAHFHSISIILSGCMGCAVSLLNVRNGLLGGYVRRSSVTASISAPWPTF